ncbi:hypothetical protein C0J52_20763 [Blattella germanica]|nr:hypothetical protein C0J52_20763 [Blattella germanica]
MVLVTSLFLALGTLQAANYLHTTMLSHVLCNPLSFFDTTPVGRILNRFSKDVDTLDNTIPHNIRAWLNCLFSVLSNFMTQCVFYVMMKTICFNCIAMSVCIHTAMFHIGALTAAALIHKGLLSNVLHLPVSFFDVTPVGRILARFSHDVNVVDGVLPHIFHMWLPQLFRMVNIIFVLVANVAASIGTLQAAAILQNLLLSNILHSPSSFFDVTPTGRILARFSSDVNTLDVIMPGLIRALLPSLFRI